MPSVSPPPPLSSTVSSVFDQFLKKLENEKILGSAARDALTQSLNDQKFDPDSLRKAIFKSGDPPT
jgi:hypothetical protein